MADKKLSPKELLERVLEQSDEELIPWESCTLPSRGEYYDGAVPGGVVEIKPMTFKTDKILATQRLAQSGKSIDHIFKNCVRFQNDFDPMNLLVGDRSFLLYYLRGITHGNIYEFATKCTNADCTSTFTDECDLNELTRNIKLPDPSIGKEPFKIVLPYLSEHFGQEFWVKLRFMRGYDLHRMFQKAQLERRIGGKRNRTHKEALDETMEKNLVNLIVEAMGSTDELQISALVGKLHAKDTAEIREFLRAKAPGIDPTISVECPDCGHEMTMELPITESFFRPTKCQRDGERMGASTRTSV